MPGRIYSDFPIFHLFGGPKYLLWGIMMEFAVLGSGSSGNSAVVRLGGTCVLVDAGLSARQLCLRLEAVGISPDELSAIVLTHEHSDHVRGIDVFCRKRKLPVYATAHTCELVREKVRSEVQWHPFEAGSAFRLGGIETETFAVPHDAVDPVGFVFRNGSASVGAISDLGHATRAVVERLRGVTTLFAEANYDEAMLQNDTRRPWATKQRISNRHGHLSNEQTAALIREVASPGLCRVVLGHLSDDCNCPDLAARIAREALAGENTPSGEVLVECAGRREPLPLRPAARMENDTASVPVPGRESRGGSRPASPRTGESSPCEGNFMQTEWSF